MISGEAYSFANWLLEQPTQQGQGITLDLALRQTHRRSINESTLTEWLLHVALAIVPLVPGGRSSIEYLDVQSHQSGDGATVSGHLLAITDTRLVRSTFKTSEDIGVHPTTSAESWARSEVRSVRLENLELPGRSEDEPWNAGGLLVLDMDRVSLSLSARPGELDKIVDLAASFSR